ncbi:hypothetical protein BMS3Bbin12_00284 [bacterium BMS3Bbin12]|nr:hypothetical protein BMS3Bbin12_00284 [bacterium BMS3Bbin12]GBE51385.1 hypothetical protein BMS3Bbin13_02343 [bacterium BMS3Bbin13]
MSGVHKALRQPTPKSGAAKRGRWAQTMISKGLPSKPLTKQSLTKLLRAEKKRRGIPQSQLVFVGIHNIAQWWWCGMYSVLKSQRNELEFFATYLADRVSLALSLDQVDTIPTAAFELLEVGAGLTLADLELHTKSSTQAQSQDIVADLISISPAIDKYENGLAVEMAQAERYPKLRWSFQWNDFVLIGIPDGITKKIVYEFKASSNEHFFRTAARPIANTQADLYGLFFGRNEKRVQVYIRETGEVITLEGPIDKDRAISTLRKFASVVAGSLPMAPKPFKCVSCEERDACTIRAR